MARAIPLSNNDSSVLEALFDPEATLSSGVKVSDSLPRSFQVASFEKVQKQERAALLSISGSDPSEADMRCAILALDQIIEENLEYASAWNNRAQARRMLFRNEQLARNPVDLKKIVHDLATAIDLATPSSPAHSVSKFDIQVLASAHTHRGYLLWVASRSPSLAKAMTENVENLRGVDKDRLEELASREFGLGGRYGNDTARQLAVRTNPYAKLCGSIVKEAMQKEITDHYQIPVNRLS